MVRARFLPTGRTMKIFNLPLTTFVSAALVATGCATTSSSNTARTASEQLLISSAIDNAFSNVQFDEFAGHRVFIDPKYLQSVDKEYVIGSLRHRVLAGGGALSTDVADCDFVLEPRSGGIGTDKQESYIGIPALGVPGLPIELPEIKLASKDTQIGTAKIGLVCYDSKTGRSVGQGGASTAVTHSSDTYVMGIGPFRSGEVVDQRSKSVGYKGVGGSVTQRGRVASVPKSVTLVQHKTTPSDPNHPAAAGAATERIATLPSSASGGR